jgi:hypothetical protein
VILCALEKDPAERFPSVCALREALLAAAPASDASARSSDQSALDTRFLATPQRVDFGAPTPVERELVAAPPPHFSLAQRFGVALPIGALALAALLLGAKLVRSTPAPTVAPAAVAMAIAPTPAPTPAPAPAKPVVVAIAPAPAPAPARHPRSVASTRERKLRSTPPAPAPKDASAAAKSGGNGWVIRRD